VIPESGDTPGPYSPNDANDTEFIAAVNTLLKEYIDAMDVVKIRLGLQIVMQISSVGNNYLQSSGLNKALMVSDPTRCAQVISRAINLIFTLSALISPFMPDTTEAILAQLNAPARAVTAELSNDILVGHTIGKPDHLFKKIEESQAEVWRIQFGGTDAAAAPVDAASTPDPLKGVPGAKKPKGVKKAAPPAGTVVPDHLKSPEALALEQKVTEQGQAIRELKAKTPKTPEIDAEIKTAVDVLKSLKEQLEEALKQSLANA
jgi:methionyl-tRNA synthetase